MFPILKPKTMPKTIRTVLTLRLRTSIGAKPQILYVRVEDSNSSCLSVTTLTLKVLSNPNPTVPDPIELLRRELIVLPPSRGGAVRPYHP